MGTKLGGDSIYAKAPESVSEHSCHSHADIKGR